MADNYLEKKYEEYLASKSGKSVKKIHVSPQPKYDSIDTPRRVFINGGADGIGHEIVKAFTSIGCKVAFCDTNNALGRMTEQTTGARFFSLDASNSSDLEECMDSLFKVWGDIDIVINNVGISITKPIIDIAIDEFDKVINTNLRSAFVTSRKLAIHRNNLNEKNIFGRIINICSTRYLMSEPGWEAYAASKGGIYSLTHALALSLADYNITVNCISPGWIQNHNYESLKESDHLQHPSRRVGKPEDIARMCIFLCDKNNTFINGENITIDGGMTKKMIYEE